MLDATIKVKEWISKKKHKIEKKNECMKRQTGPSYRRFPVITSRVELCARYTNALRTSYLEAVTAVVPGCVFFNR